MGGIGRAFKKIVSAPFRLLGMGGGGSTRVNVQAPDVSGAQIVSSTAAQAPEAPLLGSENTTMDNTDSRKKRKKGKSALLIQKDGSNGAGGNGGGYSGLNI